MDGLQFLDRVFWDNTVGEWLTALGIAVAVMLGVRLLTRVVIRRLEAFSRRTENDVDDLVAELLDRTKFLFVLLLGVWAGSLTLELSDAVEGRIRAVLVVGLLLQAAFWGTGVINYFLERYKRSQLEVDPGGATAVGAMGFVARIFLWTVFLLLALDNLGVDVTALIASLGIGGIAVALALQNVLKDLFASLSIVLDKPFVIGDFIIIGDFMGTVEHVGLKTTRIRSLGGEQLVFSNSDLLESRIRNYKRMNERRIVFSVGVTYDTGYAHLKEIPGILRRIVEEQEDTRFDRSHFKGFGDSSLTFETVYYMLVPDFNRYMDVQEAINLELYRVFDQKGVEFAFPTRTLYVQTLGNGGSRPEPVEAVGRGRSTD